MLALIVWKVSNIFFFETAKTVMIINEFWWFICLACICSLKGRENVSVEIFVGGKKALWWAWMNEKHQVFLVLFYDPRQKILSGRVGLRCRSFYCNKRKYMIKMVGENRSKSLVFVMWIFALKNLWLWFFCSLNFRAQKNLRWATL